MRVAIAITVLALSTCARAELIGYAGGAATPGVYEIDTSSAAASFLVSAQPFLATGGMASLNGDVFVTNWSPSASTAPNRFATLNLSTGSISAVAIQSSANWYGLTPDPVRNVMYVMDIEDPVLRTVSPTGVVQTIGSGLGLAVPNGIRGMAYDTNNGTLYATGYYEGTPHLYTINVNTGLATDRGSLGLPPASAGGDIPLAYLEAQNIVLAADSVARKLYSLDPLTLSLVEIGTIGLPMGSLAWVSAVPEPSTVLSLSLGIAFLIAQGQTQRKRRRSGA